MANDTLILKDRIIRGNDLELTFHKDYYWIYNDEPLPVVKYTLANCKNLDSVDLDSIDFYHDGLIIDTRREDNLSVFETTDLEDFKVNIVCDKIEKEERPYNTHDYVDLIKEILKQRDTEQEALTNFNKRQDVLVKSLKHELETVTRKINQADWLTDEKKHFLQGQQDILNSVIEKIYRKDK